LILAHRPDSRVSSGNEGDSKAAGFLS
jgi:hypothetical protein